MVPTVDRQPRESLEQQLYFESKPRQYFGLLKGSVFLLYEEKIEFEALLVLRRHVSERVPRGSPQGVHQQLVPQLRTC